MKILLTATSLLPAYGGPAYSVSGLAAALAGLGLEVGLWAVDQSAPAAPLLHDHAPVRRLAGSPRQALDNFGGTDVLHDNGMWLAHNHYLAKIAESRAIPRLVSTRGMLERWAMDHKAWKKRIAWPLYQRRDLERAQCLHATAEIEAGNVRRLGLDLPVCVIPNGVDVPDISGARIETGGGQKTALFLGRIYPVKGLLMLVEAWARARPESWRLQIAGPDQTGHRAEVERFVAGAGLRNVVSFLGPVDGERKKSVLFAADLLILPSFSESFGIVVAEALAHGLPVLTTTGAPWSMLTDRGCGWSVVPTAEGLAQGLQQATSHSAESLRAMGAKGRAWMSAEFGWQSVARQFVAVYEGLVAKTIPAVR